MVVACADALGSVSCDLSTTGQGGQGIARERRSSKDAVVDDDVVVVVVAAVEVFHDEGSRIGAQKHLREKEESALTVDR